MMKRQYFYDEQIRRYLTQLIRLFSGFQVKYLREVDGETIEKFRQIPCIWGDMSRMGASWLTDNSENVLASAPLMVLSITNFTPSPEHRMSPFYQEDTHFITKKKHPTENGAYVNLPDKMYKVSQHMPVPYIMEFNLDILVTSTNQKLEILEQLLCMFNPGFRMQANSSPFDIGKYFEIKLESVQWTSKSIPQGSSIEMDFATLGFSVTPVHLNVPSKIRRNTLVKRIITNFAHSDTDLIETTLDDLINKSGNMMYESVVVTPTEYSFEIKKEGNEYYGYVLDSTGEYRTWDTVFDTYGQSSEEDSWIRIRRTEDMDDENFDVYMKFESMDDPDRLLLKIDYSSFKVDDIHAVDKIINPNKKTPQEFGNAFGKRYLLSKAIDEDNNAWDGLHVKEMTIIESTEDGWQVMFDPEEAAGTEHYVINNTTGDQYHFNGTTWLHYLIGTYQPWYWMFDVQDISNCK